MIFQAEPKYNIGEYLYSPDCDFIMVYKIVKIIISGDNIKGLSFSYELIRLNDAKKTGWTVDESRLITDFYRNLNDAADYAEAQAREEYEFTLSSLESSRKFCEILKKENEESCKAE